MKFFTDHLILENTDVITRPIYNLDEVTQINEKAIGNLKTELKIPSDVLNSFKIKGELCPDFWKNDKLITEVKVKLTKIAKDFFDDLEVPDGIKLKDILFVGSLANYNWSKFSDIDLHLVVDFSKFKDNDEFIKKHFDAEKNVWNKKHEIKLEGFPVEIYVQDVKEKLYASAIYSVKSNKWVLEPDKAKFKVDKALIKRKVQKIFDKLKDIQHDYQAKKLTSVIKKVDKIKDQIKAMRQAGLEKGGEFSTENLVFKVLRRTEFMDLLDSFKNKSYDQESSLNEADTVIPYDERPELRAAERNGLSNKDVISDTELKKVFFDLAQARNVANAFKKAFMNGESTFYVNWNGTELTGHIPEVMRTNKDINGNPVDYSRYFDIPELGDGGFQFSLYKNGRMVGGNVRTNPNSTINNMGAATDAGYNKSFDDRVKYFFVKAGIRGKFQDKNYSIFQTPAIDAAIKARIVNQEDVIDFLKPSKAYTADKKGLSLANQMPIQDKIRKIRLDAEQILNRTIAHDIFWDKWKKDNIFNLDPEQQNALDINKATQEFVAAYKNSNPNKSGKEITMSPEDKAAFDADQARKQAILAKIRARR